MRLRGAAGRTPWTTTSTCCRSSPATAALEWPRRGGARRGGDQGRPPASLPGVNGRHRALAAWEGERRGGGGEGGETEQERREQLSRSGSAFAVHWKEELVRRGRPLGLLLGLLREVAADGGGGGSVPTCWLQQSAAAAASRRRCRSS